MKTFLLWNLILSGVCLLVWFVYWLRPGRSRVTEIHERLDHLEDFLRYRKLTLEEQDEWTALTRELEELT